jgi:DUF971 family protein
MQRSSSARRILVDGEAQVLTISWQDGHESVYPLDGLRRACPCASCVGHENMGKLPDPVVFRLPALMRWEKLRLEAVGNYAVRMTWDDGHNTGIYTWERLRSMCPCEECT